MATFFMPFERMPFGFERPIFVGAPRRSRCCTSPCASSPCSSLPCSGLIKLGLFMFLFPTVVRIGFFLGAMLMHGLFGVLVMSSIAMLVRSSCNSSEHIQPTACPRQSVGAGRATSEVKHPASNSADEVKHPATAAGPEASEKEAGTHRHLDLSSVQLVAREVDTKDEGALMTLVVAAPGVRAADLTVNAVDRYLHIKGESTKGPETFCIDRCILVPQGADMDAISATHAEGMLTLVIKKKVPKCIGVSVAPRMAKAAAAAAAVASGAEGSAQPAMGELGSSAAANTTQEEIEQYERERAIPVPLDEWEEAVPLERASKKDQ